MKTILLAALLFQLLIQVTDSSSLPAPKPKYGDIIAFQRQILRFKYVHFGIYIDKQRFKDYRQGEHDNIFEITGPTSGIADCIFSQLDLDEPNVKIFNYLDGVTDIPKVRQRTEDLITERILCKIFSCPMWKPFTNNCEHMATYIRYGLPISLQLGQSCEGKCHHKNNGLAKADEKKILDLLKDVFDGTEGAMSEHFSGMCELYDKQEKGVQFP